MQDDGNHHPVGGPAVHVPHQHAEDDDRLHILDVLVGPLHGGDIVEHQQDARHGEDEEHHEGEAAEAPGIGQLDGAARHKVRVQMEEDILGNRHNAVAAVYGIAVAEDRAPNPAVVQLALQAVLIGAVGHAFLPKQISRAAGLRNSSQAAAIIIVGWPPALNPPWHFRGKCPERMPCPGEQRRMDAPSRHVGLQHAVACPAAEWRGTYMDGCRGWSGLTRGCRRVPTRLASPLSWSRRW